MILVKAPKPLGFSKGAHKKIRTVLCLGIAIASLGGCGFDLFSGNDASNPSSNSSKTTAQTSGISYDGAVLPGQRTPITVPPPITPSSPNAPGNLSSLQPPRGINAQRLFATPIDSDDQRFERIEGAVQTLRDEIDGFAPAITRLVSVEKDIQDLVEQLDVLLQNEPAAGFSAPPPSAPPTPVVAKASELPAKNLQKPEIEKSTMAPKAVPKTMPKPKAYSGSGLNNVRISDNKGYTRIVFESSQKLRRTAELDNIEKILLIDFSDGKNNVDPSNIRMRSKLLKAASQSVRSGGGFTVAFELKNASAILKQGDITPNKDNPNHRYFIDLKR